MGIKKQPIELKEVRFRNPYLSDVSKVSWLQRAILIHSCLYYKFNTSIVPDEKYDLVCCQLAELQNSLSEKELKRTEYYNAYYDFDGSTGYHLLGRLNKQQLEYIETIASHAPHELKRKKSKKKR